MPSISSEDFMSRRCMHPLCSMPLFRGKASVKKVYDLAVKHGTCVAWAQGVVKSRPYHHVA